MKLSVILEQRFSRTPDGSVWTNGQFPAAFWNRYLGVFDSVSVIARVRDIVSADAGMQRADAAEVAFSPVPYYVGPVQFLSRLAQVRGAIRDAFNDDSAVILRVPSTLAGLAEPVLRRHRRPYGVEVVGDPRDVFAPGAVRHPLRPALRHWFTGIQKRQCAGACGAAYVTAQALQRRYPCLGYEVGVSDVEINSAALARESRVFTTHYSSIELQNRDYAVAPRSGYLGRARHRLITVGSLEQLYKGTDILIKAVANVIWQGQDIELAIIGEGRHRRELERIAARDGISSRVIFLGQLPAGAAVREELDQSALFVLPSRTEGLPRAMIEAMARGLPCIGSTAGGIPELLDEEDMVPPGDEKALATKISQVLSDPDRMARMSARNLREAHGYSDATLSERRTQFYRHVHDQTHVWLLRTDQN